MPAKNKNRKARSSGVIKKDIRQIFRKRLVIFTLNRKIYNKLIRDKIPQVIKKGGHIPKSSVMDESDFREALKIKMAEEVKELIEAKTKKEILNELSDIQELIMTIAKNYKLSMNKIEKKRKKKLQERGGFEKKLFLEYVDELQKHE